MLGGPLPPAFRLVFLALPGLGRRFGPAPSLFQGIQQRAGEVTDLGLAAEDLGLLADVLDAFTLGAVD